jgi:hypothetical protein
MEALQPTKLGVGLTNRGHEWVPRQKAFFFFLISKKILLKEAGLGWSYF